MENLVEGHFCWNLAEILRRMVIFKNMSMKNMGMRKDVEWYKTRNE